MKILAAVSFNDEMEIECKIIDNGGGPWVSWPAKKLKNSGAWYKQVIVTDDKLREAIEEGLLSKYKAFAAKQK